MRLSSQVKPGSPTSSSIMVITWDASLHGWSMVLARRQPGPGWANNAGRVIISTFPDVGHAAPSLTGGLRRPFGARGCCPCRSLRGYRHPLKGRDRPGGPHCSDCTPEGQSSLHFPPAVLDALLSDSAARYGVRCSQFYVYAPGRVLIDEATLAPEPWRSLGPSAPTGSALALTTTVASPCPSTLSPLSPTPCCPASSRGTLNPPPSLRLHRA